MTAARAAGAPPVTQPAAPRARAIAAVAAAAGALTVLVRLALAWRSFDLFGDEVVYTDLGHSVVSGGFPRNVEGPFFLHPPGFFYLEAGWTRLLGYPSSPIAQVAEMRTLNVLLAGATSVVLVLLATRAGSLRAGAVAGLLFALDPFCIRQNDRVLLDTAMMLWVLAGYLALAFLVGQPPSRRAAARAAGAGLLFGAAWLTKDEAALLILIPLLAAAALGWGPRRSLNLIAAGVTTATYAVYVAVVAANGEFSTWWQSKTTGARRLLGLVQITGFNHRGAPSLVSRLGSEALYFGTTYALLILAIPAMVLLLRRDGLPRMLGLLYLAAAAALGYAVTLGTLEENELYLLLVPSLLILPVAAALWRGGLGVRRWDDARERRRKLGTAVAAVALAAVLAVNLGACVVWLLRPDDGYAQLRRVHDGPRPRRCRGRLRG